MYANYIKEGGDGETVLDDRGRDLGYTEEFLMTCGLSNSQSDELKQLFRAFCGSGCPLRLEGGPVKGETVVDMGCGAGHDVILASQMVGSTGKIIGVDMTREMLDAAAKNVSKFCQHPNNVALIQANLEEDLCLEEEAHVVISNGVFNLTDNTRAALASVYKTLKPGGRLIFSDLCQVAKNPSAVLASSSVTDS